MSNILRSLPRVWPGHSHSRAAVKGTQAIVKDKYYVSRSGLMIEPDDTSGDLPGGIAMEDWAASGTDGEVKAMFDWGVGTVKRFKYKSVRGATGGTITLDSGSSGTIDTITADGVALIGAAITYASSLTNTAALAAAAINAYASVNNHGFYATSSGAVITIRKITPQTATVDLAATFTTLAGTVVDITGGYGLEANSDNRAAVYSVDGDEVKRTGSGPIIGYIKRRTDENGDVMRDVFGTGSFTLTGSAGTITSLTMGGTELLAGTITYTTSLSNTALLLAASINLGVASHKVFAKVSGATITLISVDFVDDLGGFRELVIVSAGGMDWENVNHVAGGIRARVDVELKPATAAS